MGACTTTGAVVDRLGIGAVDASGVTVTVAVAVALGVALAVVLVLGIGSSCR
jgi:hypothetical protein